MAQPNWLLKFIKLTFPRNPKHGKITRLPGVARWFEKRFFEGDHLVTIPKSELIRVDQSVEEEEQVVLPMDLMDHFIDRMKYHWIMNFCICRYSMGCKDYPIDYGCLFMGEAVLDINPEWGRLVSKEEAKEYVRKCEEAGLIHFMGKSKLDTRWLGIGPGEKLLTICNCCPCCCITRGLMYADPTLSEKLKKATGVSVAVDSETCVGCGKCVDADICFSQALKMEGDTCVIGPNCRGCGRCLPVCPTKAIQIFIDPEAFMQDNIKDISAIIQVPS